MSKPGYTRVFGTFYASLRFFRCFGRMKTFDTALESPESLVSREFLFGNIAPSGRREMGAICKKHAFFRQGK